MINNAVTKGELKEFNQLLSEWYESADFNLFTCPNFLQRSSNKKHQQRCFKSTNEAFNCYCFLYRRDAKPIKPRANIANVDGSGTSLFTSNVPKLPKTNELPLLPLPDIKSIL